MKRLEELAEAVIAADTGLTIGLVYRTHPDRKFHGWDLEVGSEDDPPETADIMRKCWPTLAEAIGGGFAQLARRGFR